MRLRNSLSGALVARDSSLRQPPLRMTSRGASGLILNGAQRSKESRCLWLRNALSGLGGRIKKQGAGER